MAKDKVKKDNLSKRVANCERQINHLIEEKDKVQAMIDDPDNTNDDELDVVLAEVVQALADQNAKLARLTGSTAPTP